MYNEMNSMIIATRWRELLYTRENRILNINSPNNKTHHWIFQSIGTEVETKLLLPRTSLHLRLFRKFNALAGCTQNSTLYKHISHAFPKIQCVNFILVALLIRLHRFIGISSTMPPKAI